MNLVSWHEGFYTVQVGGAYRMGLREGIDNDFLCCEEGGSFSALEACSSGGNSTFDVVV